jgi:hypothetical protein
MNALFHYNMQCQIAANEAIRLAAQQTMVNAKLSKDSQAYIYLHFIFSQGKATSQQLQALRPPGAERYAVYKSISLYLRNGLIEFEKVGRFGGIYRPAQGVTAEDVGIDLEDKA